MNKKIKKKKIDPYLPLYKALAKYIKSIGGSAVLVGGISIGQEWDWAKYNYFVRIKVTGKIPPKPITPKE